MLVYDPAQDKQLYRMDALQCLITSFNVCADIFTILNCIWKFEVLLHFKSALTIICDTTGHPRQKIKQQRQGLKQTNAALLCNNSYSDNNCSD